MNGQDMLDDIKTLLTNPCARSRFYNNDMNVHINCDKVYQKMTDYIYLGYKFNKDINSVFIEYINKHKYHVVCNEICSRIFIYLIMKSDDPPTREFIIEFLEYAHKNFTRTIMQHVDSLINYLIDKDYFQENDITILKAYIKLMLYTRRNCIESLEIKYQYTIEKILDVIKPDKECLDTSIGGVSNNDVYINNMFNTICQKGINPDITTLYKILQTYQFHQYNNLINLIEKYNIKLDLNCLEYACSKPENADNLNIIKYMLNNKIIPNRTCFRKAIIYKNFLEFTELLISYGYIPDYDDILFLANHEVYINDVDRFNIKFDDKFLAVNIKTGIDLYNISKKIKPGIESLRSACLYKSVKEINKLIKLGIKPDNECLWNACKSKCNTKKIKFLVEECGLKPDYECYKQRLLSMDDAVAKYLSEHEN